MNGQAVGRSDVMRGANEGLRQRVWAGAWVALLLAGTQAFLRWDVPSRLPAPVQQRALDVARRFLAAIGYDHGFFNMEFFFDAAADRLAVIEFNPRLASQFSDLYLRTTGHDAHAMSLALATGEDPLALPRAEPVGGAAASFVYRTFPGQAPPPMPDAHGVREFERCFPDALLYAYPREGHALSFPPGELHRGFVGEPREVEAFELFVDDAAVALREWASSGDYDLVIAHGSQFGSVIEELAPEFPDVSFAWGTDVNTFDLPNVFAYTVAADQGGYVNGTLAALMSKSGILGVIGPIEVGDAKAYVDGFAAGAKATKPDITVNITYTGDFGNVQLATEAANALVANGALTANIQHDPLH